VSRPMMSLRDDLLDGRAIVVAGELGQSPVAGELGQSPVAGELGQSLAGVGARVQRLEAGLADDDAAAWAGAHAPLHGLVYDAAGAFAGGGAGALQATLEQAWSAIRAIAAGALIPQGEGGRVVLVAPAPDAGAHAEAARAALENLARTLSIEWARYQIASTAITPGPRTDSAQLHPLVAFLLSPAGAYLSGCRLDLGAVIRSS
jgi:NAD(P)-dependent dehydrogenase (short-subunit alcohol dehydrogenase family)